MTADINQFLSLVIIDYGTGIRVAAPTSVLASITQAARNGIVIKSHGGTDAEGFAAAVDLGYDMARYELQAKISQTLGSQKAAVDNAVAESVPT